MLVLNWEVGVLIPLVPDILHIVEHLQYTSWKENENPSETRELIQLVNEAQTVLVEHPGTMLGTNYYILHFTQIPTHRGVEYVFIFPASIQCFMLKIRLSVFMFKFGLDGAFRHF